MTNEIIFVTTSLGTKWGRYSAALIQKYFPDAQHLIIDGRGNWPKSWFYWIDEVAKSDKKYYIHIDEDCFIINKEEIERAINMVRSGEYDMVGCPDAYMKHYRHHNPIIFNTFLMIGKVEDLHKTNGIFRDIQFRGSMSNGIYHWHNLYNLYYKPKYSEGYNYPHPIEEEPELSFTSFENECEPYYAFQWFMKEHGAKFGYLYPSWGEDYNTTNPRIDVNSPPMAIHMWYTREWNSEAIIIEGMSNRKRYEGVERFLNEEYNMFFI